MTILYLTLGVLFVERPYVEGIGGIDFASGRRQRRRVLLLIHQVPVHSLEKGMFFKFVGSLSPAPESLVDVSLQRNLKYRALTFNS